MKTIGVSLSIERRANLLLALLHYTGCFIYNVFPVIVFFKAFHLLSQGLYSQKPEHIELSISFPCIRCELPRDYNNRGKNSLDAQLVVTTKSYCTDSNQNGQQTRKVRRDTGFDLAKPYYNFRCSPPNRETS